ncbi:ECF RNA polymerase sigma factor SigF [Methylobacterium adhaesivum]|jgi:RNA polymerase sigma-70 factor (ECF subfamily)|uniref:Sigma-70 family RNA polymerase sigma factor n=1 Tax=Methylobacterium adhaesivum TaxID=333297 RepID=A0ABT8BML7_9HYPH|nr:sigma-70 family RNA polymerase sigma factor [Methylobacterium adhaesivum]MDN3592605.1 sigma-70 family RNA polymerase sigma factor [Methylobacterium adhaesivum]GJD30209.1 ECF RNA polymerase sigma factor SigF [Methylobacterium adhaesivum]
MSPRPTLLPGEASFSVAMQAAQDGDTAAYRALLRDCVPIIAAMARAKGVRGAALDDVVQDTLLTVHRARATYDPARPFLPWLRAITQRRAIDALRHMGRRPREVHEPLAYEAHADEAAIPGDDLERRDRAAILAAAVAHLPDGQREAIEHIALRELSLEEASALTGRTKGALKVNFHRGLKSLRTLLSPRHEGTDV